MHHPTDVKIKNPHVCIEDINIKKRIKESAFEKSIAEVGWHEC
jgi:hypothetical protein